MWSDAATWTGAVAAVIAAVVAIAQTRKASQAAQAAEISEARAVAAAERSAAAMSQSADAHGSLASLAEVDARKPPWALLHRAGDTHEVVNDGPTTKFAVRVQGESIVPVAGQSEPGADRLEAGSSLGFWAAVTMEVGSREISVCWRDVEEGEERMWSRALPSRP